MRHGQLRRGLFDVTSNFTDRRVFNIPPTTTELPRGAAVAGFPPNRRGTRSRDDRPHARKRQHHQPLQLHGRKLLLLAAAEEDRRFSGRSVQLAIKLDV